MAYRWLGPELGGYRRQAHARSPHTALRSRGLWNHADHMDTGAFRHGTAELVALANDR